MIGKIRNYLLLLLVFLTADAYASQPLRRTMTLPTQDGRCVEVRKCGNARHSWFESADGQLWLQGANRHLTPLRQAPSTLRRAFDANTSEGIGVLGQSGKGVVKSVGECRIPVVMVAYADLDFQDGHDAEKVERYLNAEGYAEEQWAVGSVADYFRMCSYGKFRPQFDVVAKVTLPNGYRYYGAHSGTLNDTRVVDLVNEAVRLAAEQGADFTPYAQDGRAPIVSIIHAGPGEHEDFGEDCGDYVWAHFRTMSIDAGKVAFSSYIIHNEVLRYFDDSGNVSAQPFTGIGTFCHEFGHALGLPDIYDTDGSVGGEGMTPGYWDIMDYQFMLDGYCPISYSAYERSLLGWVDIAAAEERPYTLAPLDSQADTSFPRAVRIVNPQNEKEYFILENRQESPFFLPQYMGNGMLVWHIDYEATVWNANRVNALEHLQRVQVVPADGAWQDVSDLNNRDENNACYTFAGDIFPGYEEVTVFDANKAAFHSGTFTVRVSDIGMQDDGLLTFCIGNASAVETVGQMATDAPWYGLDGRKYKGSTWPGICIRNGQVVLLGGHASE